MKNVLIATAIMFFAFSSFACRRTIPTTADNLLILDKACRDGMAGLERKMQENIKKGIGKVIPTPPPSPTAAEIKSVLRTCDDFMIMGKANADFVMEFLRQVNEKWCKMRTHTTEESVEGCEGIPPDPVNLKNRYVLCIQLGRMEMADTDVCRNLITLEIPGK